MFDSLPENGNDTRKIRADAKHEKSSESNRGCERKLFRQGLSTCECPEWNNLAAAEHLLAHHLMAISKS
jgi:plasmid stability protein